MQWINILLNCATLLTAYATWFTVKEMRRGREQANTPFLIVLEPEYKYQFRWIPLEDIQPIIKPKAKNVTNRLPIFRIKNIGNTPAINIKIYWEMDGDDLENIIRKNSILKKFNAKINSKRFSISKNENEYKSEFCQPCFDKASSILDYSIASPGTNFIQALPVPNEINSSYIIRLMAVQRPSSLSKLITSSIKLKIAYEGMDGRKYQESFTIESTFLFFPDNITGENHPDNKYFSPDNIRGDITFKVKRSENTLKKLKPILNKK